MYKAGAVRLFPTLKGVIGALGVFSGPIAADDKSRMLPRAATCEISNTSHDTHLHYSAARGAEYCTWDLKNTDVLEFHFLPKVHRPYTVDRVGHGPDCVTLAIGRQSSV